MPYQFTQIFCDHCSSLALARLDGIHLCTQCLVNVVTAHRSNDIAKISPLKFSSRAVKESTPVVG